LRWRWLTPYLPGAGTDAFNGFSVLIGGMISPGASSVVGQAAAGLILTYTRTLLSDFYPQYRLVAQTIPSQPRPRAVLLSMLHANIQEVFNEYGVQIMSPHYLSDPPAEKWVPRDKWFTARAQEPKDP